MSTEGLSGILPWIQARHIAATCARPLPGVTARLTESAGNLLAAPLLALTDDPPCDVAAVDGFAVCGPGPWGVTGADRLTAGRCTPVARDEPLPDHADAVLPHRSSQDRAGSIVAVDELTGIPDEDARPPRGSGIVRRGERGAAGRTLLDRERAVTAGVLALAAAQGYDELAIRRPPVVATVVVGRSLLTHGLPRRGRARDALGVTIPAFVASLGARGNPAVHASDTPDLLIAQLEDTDADVIVTTGGTSPGSLVRQVLRDLGARWLIDGVAATPGAQMLLARLPDDRFLVGLPGEPTAALAGLVTLVPPIIDSLRGVPSPARTTAHLTAAAPSPDFTDDVVLVPVQTASTSGDNRATPLGRSLAEWARADAVAVIPPGTGERDDPVLLLPL